MKLHVLLLIPSISVVLSYRVAKSSTLLSERFKLMKLIILTSARENCFKHRSQAMQSVEKHTWLNIVRKLLKKSWSNLRQVHQGRLISATYSLYDSQRCFLNIRNTISRIWLESSDRDIAQIFGRHPNNQHGWNVWWRCSSKSCDTSALIFFGNSFHLSQTGARNLFLSNLVISNLRKAIWLGLLWFGSLHEFIGLLFYLLFISLM